MSKAIVKRVDLKLNKAQTAKLRTAWKSAAALTGGGGSMFAMNMMTEAGPFPLINGVVRVAVLDMELTVAMNTLLMKHKKARP